MPTQSLPAGGEPERTGGAEGPGRTQTKRGSEVTYTWDEMVEVDCLLSALKEGLKHECVIFSPESVADVLEAIAPRIVKPDRIDAFRAGLAKLRGESPVNLSAWCTAHPIGNAPRTGRTA